jgi:hypothetical protein
MHLAVSEQRFVGDDSTDLIFPDDVLSGDDPYNTFGILGFAERQYYPAFHEQQANQRHMRKAFRESEGYRRDKRTRPAHVNLNRGFSQRSESE